LECTGNYSATSNDTKLAHWPLTKRESGRGSEEGTGQDSSPPSPLLAVPIVTAHPSTAGVSITVFLYNGLLLYGYNVPIKG